MIRISYALVSAVCLSLGASSLVNAQEQQTADVDQYPKRDRCATMPALEHQLHQHPTLEQSMTQGEIAVQKWIDAHPEGAKGGGLTIPVVVHVVHDPNNPASNIPDAQIHSQIDVLNEDFRRLNSNAGTEPPYFDTIAADLDINFCMATSDPNGNWTTGIIRVSSTTSHALTPFTNSVKSSASGGADPWPADQYLNVWICDMSFFGQPAVLGYAQFPLSTVESQQAGAVAEQDGVVIQYQYFGRTNDPNTAPSNLGRTMTHEVGHWLGLRHVWGDGDCTEDDYVDDTPLADDQSQFDCNISKNSCDDTSIPFWANFDAPDMVQNYMDYSSDACMSMFSNGQSQRIWGFLNTDSLRMGLFNSNGCAAPTSTPEITLAEQDLNVFPNPAGSVVQVDIPSDRFSRVEVELLNELGQVIETKIPTGEILTFDLSTQARGLYLVRLVTNEGVITKKLMVR